VHVSNVDVGSLAKDGSRGVSAGRHAHRWTTAFLTAEFGLTMVTVAGIVLGWRQTRDAARADLEIAPERIVTAGVTLSSPRYASPEKKVAFYDAVAERVGRAPEVAAFAVATYAPRGGAAARPTLIEGEDRPAGQPPPTAWVVTIGGRYFEALGLHVVKGRAFDERDGSPGHAAVIVNSRFVDMYLRSREPIGRRIALIDPAAPGSPEWLTVVGVSPTIRQRPTPDPDPMAYVPIRMAPPLNAVLLARATTDAARIAPALRAAAAAIDPTLPLDRLMSMEQAMTLAQWNGRLSVALLDGIGLVALALAAIGVYAVTSYSVTQRRQEIGVRMALGADGRQIAAMVLGRAARQLAWGLGAGVVCIAAWGRLFGDGGDPHGGMSGLTNLAIVAAVIGVVVAAACVVPVRRAARLDPVVALRRE
jgi:predicted permease